MHVATFEKTYVKPYASSLCFLLSINDTTIKRQNERRGSRDNEYKATVLWGFSRRELEE